MVFSMSSIAIWWVSRLESLEMEVRILCLNSTIATKPRGGSVKRTTVEITIRKQRQHDVMVVSCATLRGAVVAKWWWSDVDDGYADVVVAEVAFWRWVFEVAEREGGATEMEQWRERKEIRNLFSHTLMFHLATLSKCGQKQVYITPSCA